MPSKPIATVEAVRDAMLNFNHDAETALRALGELYADAVVFQDPLQRIEGREAVLNMNRRLIAWSRRLNVRVHDARESGDHLYLSWTFEYATKVTPALRFEGMSDLTRSEGLIVHHRDYWDLFGPAMDAVPGLGSVYRALVRRLLGG